MPRDVYLFRKPWLSLGFSAEHSGKGVLRHPPIQEALEKRVRENEGSILLVLTYHPLTSRVKHILLNNYNILTTDPATATIFPTPPAVAHRRDLTLRDVLLHTSDRSQTEEPRTFACRHVRCRTCLYTASNVHVYGTKSST